jgi:copper chaperone CopZ
MPGETLNIKNMVCNRCIRVVGDELRKLGIEPVSIELGKAELDRQLTDRERENVRTMLLDNGFQIIDDRKGIIIEKIRTLVIEMIHYRKEKARHINVSDFIEREIGYDYSYLSNLFFVSRGYHHRKIYNKPENRKGEGMAGLR